VAFATTATGAIDINGGIVKGGNLVDLTSNDITLNGQVRGTMVTLDEVTDGVGTVTVNADPNNVDGSLDVESEGGLALNADMTARDSIYVNSNVLVDGGGLSGFGPTVNSISGDVLFFGAIDDNGSGYGLSVWAPSGDVAFYDSLGDGWAGGSEFAYLDVWAEKLELGSRLGGFDIVAGDVDFTNVQEVELYDDTVIDTISIPGGQVLFKDGGVVYSTYDAILGGPWISIRMAVWSSSVRWERPLSVPGSTMSRHHFHGLRSTRPQ